MDKSLVLKKETEDLERLEKKDLAIQIWGRVKQKQIAGASLLQTTEDNLARLQLNFLDRYRGTYPLTPYLAPFKFVTLKT